MCVSGVLIKNSSFRNAEFAGSECVALRAVYGRVGCGVGVMWVCYLFT